MATEQSTRALRILNSLSLNHHLGMAYHCSGEDMLPHSLSMQGRSRPWLFDPQPCWRLVSQKTINVHNLQIISLAPSTLSMIVRSVALTRAAFSALYYHHSKSVKNAGSNPEIARPTSHNSLAIGFKFGLRITDHRFIRTAWAFLADRNACWARQEVLCYSGDVNAVNPCCVPIGPSPQ